MWMMEFATAAAVCLICVFITLSFTVRPSGPNSIPGPRFTFPILGHLPLLGAEPWLTFTKWTKLFGPIFSIKLGAYEVIVLNESKLIKEAFSRPQFSGRPSFEIFLPSGAKGKGIAFNDGSLVEEQRNFARKSLHGFGLRKNLLQQNIQFELTQVLEEIDRKCGQSVSMKGIFSIPVANGIWSIFMGRRFELDDPRLQQIANGLRSSLTSGMVVLGLFFPTISKYMLEYSGLKKTLEGAHVAYAVVKEAFDKPLPATTSLVNPQNFKETFINEMEQVGDNIASSFHPSHNSFQYSAGDILLASLDTTNTTLEWLLTCLATHLEVQKKVSAEIDEKIGAARLPELADKVKTPYIDAVIQELLRFSSMVPLALFHRTMEDTQFLGYNIKKDTLLISNSYAVHYDRDVWGDPENFRPERFMDPSGNLDRNLIRITLPFGTGRRSCIGENLSRDQIYLYLVGIFQRYSVTCKEGTRLDNISCGTIRAPKDYQLVFTRRLE